MRFMNRAISNGLLGLVLVLLSIAHPAALMAQEEQNEQLALITIRFNKPNVYYKPHLKTAVLQAVAAKKSVQFVLTNYIPQTPSSSRNAEHERIARHNLRKVHDYMVALGVSRSQISVQQQPAPDLLYDEVRIYVY